MSSAQDEDGAGVEPGTSKSSGPSPESSAVFCAKSKMRSMYRLALVLVSGTGVDVAPEVAEPDVRERHNLAAF